MSNIHSSLAVSPISRLVLFGIVTPRKRIHKLALHLMLPSMLLFLVEVCPARAFDNAAGTTYLVGTCKPNLPNFSTISDAVASVPPGSTVQVCPGTYHEQVTITQPLTLQGISVGDTSQAVLAPPFGGLATNGVMDDSGDSLAVQLYVSNVASPGVNIINLTIDGSGNNISSCTAFVVGVFYQNSFGTVNRLTVRNQNGCGYGIWAEGGSSNPTVTIENSSVHDQTNHSIFAQTNSAASELATTIKGNYVTGSSIAVGGGSTNTVTGNVVFSSGVGILTYAVAGSVTGNTVMNTELGIDGDSSGTSITSNRIVNSSKWGILVEVPAEIIQSNTIENSPAVAIEFECTVDTNVNGNIINDASIGLDRVPSALSTPNSYFNVTTIKTGGC